MSDSEERRFKVPSLAPGVVTRIKYASYLFIGLLTCLLLRGALGKAISDVPYLSKGCQLDMTPPTTTTTEEPSLHRLQPLKAFVEAALPAAASDIANAAQSAEQAAATLASWGKRMMVTCYQNVVVYRVSFSLAIFYLLHLCSVSDCTCCIDDENRVELQTSFFTFKSFLLLVLNIVVFWIPNDFFVVYAYICMIVSGIFLLMQIALIVDFSYVWNEEWTERNEDNAKWGYYLIAVTVIMNGTGIALTVYNYYNFVPFENCNLHGFVVTACLLGGLVYTAVSIYIPHGSVLPSSMIFAYTSFVVTSALEKSTDARCNRLFVPAGKESIGMILGSALIAAGVLAYSVVSMSGKYYAWDTGDESSGHGDAEDPPEVKSEGGVNGDAHHSSGGHGHVATSVVGHVPAYMYFHGVLLIGSMYLAMLGTDWQISGNYHDASTDIWGTANGTQGHTGTAMAMWVKIVTSWITIAAYLWSLLAPYYCCRHRDYGYDVAAWENS